MFTVKQQKFVIELLEATSDENKARNYIDILAIYLRIDPERFIDREVVRVLMKFLSYPIHFKEPKVVFDLMQKFVFENPYLQINLKEIFVPDDFETFLMHMGSNIDFEAIQKRSLFLGTSRLFIHARPELAGRRFITYILERMNSDGREVLEALRVFRVIKEHVETGRLLNIGKLIDLETIEAAFMVQKCSVKPEGDPQFNNEALVEVQHFFDFLMAHKCIDPQEYFNSQTFEKLERISPFHHEWGEYFSMIHEKGYIKKFTQEDVENGIAETQDSDGDIFAPTAPKHESSRYIRGK